MTEKGYYHDVYILLHFNKEDGVNRRENNSDMESYLDDREMEDLRLENERELYYSMGLEENEGLVDDEKLILHAKRWDVYMNNKLSLIKARYYV